MKKRTISKPLHLPFRPWAALGAAACLALLGGRAEAHVGYGGRDFGVFNGTGSEPAVTLLSAATGNFGWADGTDDTFGDSHRLRAFRFTLHQPSLITLDVTGTTAGFLPAFSIYSGLAHVEPDTADHDLNPITVLYLASLGGPAKDGAFNALADWKIGNTDRVDGENTIPASLSTFLYLGNRADGTSTNYGTAAGIHGDGLADNFVSGTFALPAGDYSIFIGGGDYAAKGPSPSSYNFSATLTVVPEPASGLLIGLAALGLLGRRRRVN